MPSRRHRKRSDWARRLPPPPTAWSDCDADSSTSSSSPNLSFDTSFKDPSLPTSITYPSSSSSSSSTSSCLRTSNSMNLSSRIRSRRNVINRIDTDPSPFNHHNHHHVYRHYQSNHLPSSSSSRISPLATSPSPVTTCSTSTSTTRTNHHTILRTSRQSIYQPHYQEKQQQHHRSQQRRQPQQQPQQQVDMRTVSFSEYTAAELPDLAFFFRSFFPSKPQSTRINTTTTSSNSRYHHQRPFVSAPVLNIPDDIDSEEAQQTTLSQSQSPLQSPAQSPSSFYSRNTVELNLPLSAPPPLNNSSSSINEIDGASGIDSITQIDLSNVSNNNSPSLLIVRLEFLLDSTYQTTCSILEKLVNR